MTSPLERTDPEIAGIIERELERQNTTIQLIASGELHLAGGARSAGLGAHQQVLRGLSGQALLRRQPRRRRGREPGARARGALFGAEHANVQPHSGANANQAAFMALLEPGDKVMGMRLDQGGHLTHGSPVNFSGRMYDFVAYGVDDETETLDYDVIRDLARGERPKMIIAGATAYPRIIDFEAFRAIADEVGALLLVDAAHIAGLVAGGAHPSPVPRRRRDVHDAQDAARSARRRDPLP